MTKNRMSNKSPLLPPVSSCLLLIAIVLCRYVVGSILRISLTEMLLKHLSIAGGGGEEVKCAMGYRCVREKDAEEGCVYLVPGRGRERSRVNVRDRSLEKESVNVCAMSPCRGWASGMLKRGWGGLAC